MHDHAEGESPMAALVIVAFAFLIVAPAMGLLSRLDSLADQVDTLPGWIATELRNVVDPLSAATAVMKDQAPQLQVFLLSRPVPALRPDE
jgi:hypothetical protein